MDSLGLMQSDGPSDAELLRSWVTGDQESAGETFISIYARYRDTVRGELEAAGLTPREAEDRLGAVFVVAERMRADVPPEIALADRLVAAAREVAADPNPTPTR
jgi:hypothetical protein